MISQSIPQDRIRIFNRRGFPLAEFDTAIARSWTIAREGRATFKYPVRKTNVVDKDVLNFGNYLLIENDTLPAWIGIIDTPREWDSTTVAVAAYTMERMFRFRRGPREKKLTGSAGTIFKQMLQHINVEERTIIRAGDIWQGGKQREETLNPNTLDVNLRQLQKNSREEYNFTHVVEEGKLQIYAHWYEKLGEETPLYLTESKKGGNMEAPSMIEDGQIVNDILGYGDGVTWDSRPFAITRDDESISEYGLRQDGKSWRGVSEVGTISNNNDDFIFENKQPRRIVQCNALNVGSTFQFLELGNQLKVVMQNAGFQEGLIGTNFPARITGMSYNPGKNKNSVKLVLEEIL